MVEANTTKSAETQQSSYTGQKKVTFAVGQRVSLDNPTRGKLDPHWTGPWNIISIKGPLTLELQMRSTKLIVHVNRVRPMLLVKLTIPPLVRTGHLLYLHTMRIQSRPKTIKPLIILSQFHVLKTMEIHSKPIAQ